MLSCIGRYLSEKPHLGGFLSQHHYLKFFFFSFPSFSLLLFFFFTVPYIMSSGLLDNDGDGDGIFYAITALRSIDRLRWKMNRVSD